MWSLTIILLLLISPFVFVNINICFMYLGAPMLGKQPQECRWYHSNGRKWGGTKEPLDESERGEWDNWLKTQH